MTKVKQTKKSKRKKPCHLNKVFSDLVYYYLANTCEIRTDKEINIERKIVVSAKMVGKSERS